MSNLLTTSNSTNFCIKSEIFYRECTQSKTQFNISEFIFPIFSKAKNLYSHYIEAPVCMIANTPNTVIQKTVQASSWIFTTSPTTLITSYFQNLHNFNPFNSKTWNLITPSSIEPQEPSYKDFEMLAPIIIDHKDTRIDTTSFSIAQIKQDLHRMDIYVNNLRCTTIEDFTRHLGLTLNSTKTDILTTDNPLIPKVLHFSHQGLLRSGLSAFQKRVMEYPNKFPAQIQDKPLAIHISWDPTSPETTEITGEVSFHVKCMETGNILPCIYTVKTKCSLDKEEITWEAIKEIPNEFQSIEEENIESSFVFVDAFESKKLEERDKEVPSALQSTQEEENLESSFADLTEELENKSVDIDACKKNITDSAFDRTLTHLLHNNNSGLQPGMTSEYLTALNNKYPNFVYNDRLMYGNIPVTMDTIIDFLTDLQQQHPSNQIIFLPFLVKGWTVDHAVVAVLNLSNQTIEYFDPKGQSWFTTRVEKQLNKNVFEFLTEIGKKIISPTFSQEKVLYNKQNIPQGSLDNINCGVFCLQFIEERLNHSFDRIEAGIPDRPVDPLKLRYQLANNLIKNTNLYV